MYKTKSLIIKVFVAVTYLAMVTVNFMANYLPINGVTSGQVSDSYPNLFAPAGITFSIWGLIYVLLGVYAFYQLGCLEKKKTKNWFKLTDKIGLYFIISSLANILWIFSWHYGFIGLSFLWIIIILISLIKIADILRKEKLSSGERSFIFIPFSVYFGWITVAVIANITVFLVSLGWNGFGVSENFWTILILIVSAIIGLWRMFKDKSIFYGLVFIWAYLGIFIKNSNLDLNRMKNLDIMMATVVCVIAFLIAIPLLCDKKRK
jgi:hypothetical protein